MDFVEYIKRKNILLTEGSIFEKLRRYPNINLDPYIDNASLVYDSASKSILETVVKDYLAIGQEFSLPMLTLTNTWSASVERIKKSRFSNKKVNNDCVMFYRDIISELSNEEAIYLGGLTGPNGDVYKPEESLKEDESYSFHLPQVFELADSGVDFLFASTLPAKMEAKGIAHAMSEVKIPYVISFVIRQDGTLLDGSLLRNAIEEIDKEVSNPPLFFMINCTHANTFRLAYPSFSQFSHRIGGLQANTSARDPEELDGSDKLETEEPTKFAHTMSNLRKDFNIQVLGGCCGTDTPHIRELAKKLCDLTNNFS